MARGENLDLYGKELKKVGEVGVDSGQVIITDPCYLDDWKDGEFHGEDKPIQSNNDYDEACRITLGEGAGQLKRFSGVVSRTAYGDGLYPVYAVMDKKGTIHGLIIDFDGIVGETDDD